MYTFEASQNDNGYILSKNAQRTCSAHTSATPDCAHETETGNDTGLLPATLCDVVLPVPDIPNILSMRGYQISLGSMNHLASERHLLFGKD